MLTVYGYYDGEAFQALEQLTLQKHQQVMITVLDNIIELPQKEDEERLKKIKALRGCLHKYAKPNVEEAMKAEDDCMADMPNEETLAAMEEAEKMLRDPNTQKFSSVEDLFAELRS